MELAHKHALQQNKMRLRDDLDVSGMLDCLVADDVITEKQQAGILSEKTSGLRTIALMDILMDSGPNAYPLFVEYLKRMQPHLAEGFPSSGEAGEAAGCEAAPDSLSQTSVQERRNLVDERRSFLEDHLDADAEILDLLVREEVFTSEDRKHIQCQNSKLQESKELLLSVLKKGPEACLKFGEVLSQTQPKLAEAVARYEKGELSLLFGSAAPFRLLETWLN